MFPSQIKSFHKFAKGLANYCEKSTSENARELLQNTVEELCDSLNDIENEHIHLLFHISELLQISGNAEKLDEFIYKAIVETTYENVFKRYVNGFAFLLINSPGDYRRRWNNIKDSIYQLFGKTDFVLHRINEFEEAIAVVESDKNNNYITPPYKQTTHLSKINSFHEFVNRLVKFCREGHYSENLIQSFIKELCDSLDKLKDESTKQLYYISKLNCITGNLKKLDEYILKAILKNICEDIKPFKESINGFIFLLTRSDDYISRFSAIKDCLYRTLGNSEFIMQRIRELENIISKKNIIPKKIISHDIYEKIKIASNEIRNIITETAQIVKIMPLDFEALFQKTDSLCSSMDFIGSLKVEFQIEEIPIPYRVLNDEYLKPLFKKTEIFPVKSQHTKFIIRTLLKVNDRLLMYFSPKDTQLLFNLFDRIEYLRLHKDLWSEYNFEELVKRAYKVGEKIYDNFESYALGQQQKETSLGRIGEICRDMVQFNICKPDEKIDLLLKSNNILQKSIERDGELILRYFGRNYFIIGLNYIDLRQWEDAIACFMKIKDIDPQKNVKKKKAFEAREKIGDCYIKLGLEEKSQGMSGFTQYFRAEKFYNEAGSLPKDNSDDGKHLLGKLANLYYFSSQHKKALPLYEKILQNESSLLPENKNLYDCLSYRKGVCLFFMSEIDEAIKQFEYTLRRNPEKEHKIKSYFWLLKLHSIKHERDKYQKIKEFLLSDEELVHILNDNKLDVLLTDKMEDYIKEITNRLKSGDHWLVIDELKKMIKSQKLIEGPNYEDTILLTKLAEAYMEIGESDLALETFNHIKDIDNAPKNVAIALAGIGKVYMEKGEYQRAISTFQKSFEYGHDIRMLFFQASAHFHLKEYDKAIQLYNEILNSGRDKKPWITKAGIAKAIWSKYLDAGQEDDAKKAVDYIASIIEEYPDDKKTYDIFVRMSNKPIALDRIVYLIKEGKNITIKRNLLEQLAFHNVFSNEIISSCLISLSLRDTAVNGYWDYVLVSVDFLMKATIYFYFFKDKDSFNKIVKDIINCILNLGNGRDILREYLCASKGAYPDFLEEAYSKEVKKILSLLSTEHIDDINETLNNKVFPNIVRFIQSEIPEELIVFYDNYKGKEPVGVDIKSELLKQFYGTDDLEREGKRILNYASNIDTSIKVPYLSWFLFGKLVDLFYPYPDGLWNEILSLANKWTIEIKPVVDNNVNIHFSAQAIVDELSEDFKRSFEKIKREHTSCQVPRASWFEYALSEDLIKGEKYECKLLLTIKMSQCHPLKVCFQSLTPFLDHMISSFEAGLFGTFKREEYRQKAKELFPVNINLIKAEQWIDLVHIYLDWHFSLLFNNAIHDDKYRKTIHDCIKGPLQQIQLNTNDEIMNYLANIERLPTELGRTRRHSLESITSINTFRKLDLGEIIKNLVDSLESVNNDVIFNLNISPCKLISGYESLLKQAFSNLLNNAAAAVRLLKITSKNISIFVFQDTNDVNVVIKNPMDGSEVLSSTQFSTGIGLKSVRYIIEKDHCGKMTVDPNDKQKVYIVKVSFPINAGK